MKKVVLIMLIGILVFSSFVFINGCSKKENVIKIGAILPLTGNAAVYGKNAQKGIELARYQINTDCINNKKIEIIYEDSRGRVTDGVAAFKKLIEVNKVDKVIGAVLSSVTLAIAPIAEKNKVVLLSPLSAAPAITNAGDYIFRNVPSDYFGGAIAAEFAISNMNWGKIGILYINNDWGVGLSKRFEEVVKYLGGEIIISIPYKENETDFRTEIAKLKEKSQMIDVFFLVGYNEIPIFLIQAKEIGLHAKYLGTGMLESPNLINIAKDAADGIYFTQLQYDPYSEDELIQQFVNSYKNEYNSEPDIMAAYGYDALFIIANALQQVSNQEEFLKKLQETNIKGVTGEISFDLNGDVKQPMGVKIIEDGKFVWFKKDICIE